MLTTLYERDGLPSADVPPRIVEAYDGGIGFAGPRLFANFVATIDGVAALGGIPDSPGIISAHSEGDRFVMAVLRSFASAVVIGAGTLRDALRHVWTAEHVFPSLGAEFAEFRSSLGLAPQPTLVVLSGRGNVEPDHRAFDSQPVTVLTSPASANHLASFLPSSVDVVAMDTERFTVREVVTMLRSEGHDMILSEAGPTTTSELLRERLLDELFLTVSPLFAGRKDETRPGILQGIDFLPEVRSRSTLLSVKKHDDHLFLRYQVNKD